MPDSSRPGADHDSLTVLRALIEMSRPDQLLLMVLLYATGVLVAVVAGATLDPLSALVGFLLFSPVAVSVHYANEYADYETDHLTTRTPFSGGSGALVRTGLPRRLALRAAVAALVLAAVAVGVVAGIELWATGRVTTVPDAKALGLLALIAVLGWQYSLPPLALAWHGWGELDNALLGGVLLPVYGVAVAGEVTVASVLAFLPFGCVVFVNLLATTWPDRAADAAVGKATLATRLSAGRLRWLYAGGLLAGGVSMAAVHGGPVPAVVCWASLLAAPFLLWGLLAYTRRRSPFPTVAGMVLLAGAQFAGWVVAGL
ncbi:prenyltransferase [Salinirubrum litoreum]|uniref:Prenyltransferase n=1 Tax=Salinirubrum litoreum TaxID=1126234 RepID=A0ABD5RBK8_9EURY